MVLKVIVLVSSLVCRLRVHCLNLHNVIVTNCVTVTSHFMHECIKWGQTCTKLLSYQTDTTHYYYVYNTPDALCLLGCILIIYYYYYYYYYYSQTMVVYAHNNSLTYLYSHCLYFFFSPSFTVVDIVKHDNSSYANFHSQHFNHFKLLTATAVDKRMKEPSTT